MLRGFSILALVLALAAAGCVGLPDAPSASIEPSSIAALPADRVVTFAAGLVLPPDDDFAGIDVRLAPTGFPGGEPSIGVTSDGAIFVAVQGKEVARSLDHGASWKIVSPPATDLLVSPKTSLDPWVWVDPLTDRVFDAPLYVVCTWAAFSDDKGETWDAYPTAGCGIPAHDHQKLTTGVPAPGVETQGYPNVVYYSYNSFRRDGTVVTQSYDGGRTWALGQSVHEADDCHSGVAGPVIVASDGTAYSGKPTCKGVDVAVSKDSGQTWGKPVSIDGVGAAEALAHMVDVATDAADNAYVTWTGDDGAAYVASSVDGGESWSAPKRVSPPGLGSTVYNVIVAGEAGRVAVGFLGTEADSSGWATVDAESAPAGTVWHAYLSFLDDATAAEPIVTTVQVTPDDDPVQIGCIWQSGGSHPCRNLGDFIDLTLVDGRPYLVYADGCDKCRTDADSRGREAVVAIVEAGPSLVGGLLTPLGR